MGTSGLITVGETDITLVVKIWHDDGKPYLGLVAATLPVLHIARSSNIAVIDVTTHDLTSVTDAHSDGGVFELGGGRYRFDAPDSAWTLDTLVEVYGEDTDLHVDLEPIVVRDPNDLSSVSQISVPFTSDVVYADIIYGNEYFGTRLHSDEWFAASPSDRNKALAMSTRAFNRLRYTGCKTNTSQTNEFPRDDNDVPSDIRIACCEEALALLKQGDSDDNSQTLNVISEGFEGVRTTYDRNAVIEHVAHGIVSPTAWRYLLPYLKDSRDFKICRVS